MFYSVGIQSFDRTDAVAVLHGLRAAVVGNPVNRLILAALLRVVRTHKRLADTASEQSFEEKRPLDLGDRSAMVARKRLNLVIQPLLNQRLVFAWKKLVIELDASAINRIRQDIVERHLSPGLPGPGKPSSAL